LRAASCRCAVAAAAKSGKWQNVLQFSLHLQTINCWAFNLAIAQGGVFVGQRGGASGEGSGEWECPKPKAMCNKHRIGYLPLLFAPSKLICCGSKGTQSIKRECYNLSERSQAPNTPASVPQKGGPRGGGKMPPAR